MTSEPIILIHGYSDKGKSFNTWKSILESQGFNKIHTISWQSLVNEINIVDIAEGFDRALRVHLKLKTDDTFNCIVHSTGMLVIREWLVKHPSRAHQLKRLIALAPATFGSPLAHKGRSLIGSVVKGNREFGPDFLEAGDLVLDALELASPYTWDLAEKDLFGDKIFYGSNSKTPYVFSFCGEKKKSLFGNLAGEGSDGVVRMAGASLDSRKIFLDFTRSKKLSKSQRSKICKFTHIDSPVVPVHGADHGDILHDPDKKLIQLVTAALNISSRSSFEEWHIKAAKAWWKHEKDKPQFQQFIIKALDERDQGIEDYTVRLYTKTKGHYKEVEAFTKQVSSYSKDSSFRCFHVDLKKLNPDSLSNLWIKIVLASNTHYVGYSGYDGNNAPLQCIPDGKGLSEFNLDITKLLKTKDFSLFHPRTTTLVEMKFERNPLPADTRKSSPIAIFDS